MVRWISKMIKKTHTIIFRLAVVDGNTISPNCLSKKIYDFCNDTNILITDLRLSSDCCFLYVKCNEIKLNKIITKLFGDILDESTFIISCRRNLY